MARNAFRYLLKHKLMASADNFNFKIIHNYLNINDNLYKWILVETSLCSYCLTEVENLTHLFCFCSFVKTLYFQTKERIT